MDLVQDDGGEHMDVDHSDLQRLDAYADNAAAGPSQTMERTFIEDDNDEDEGDGEGPDEQSESPALYLRKFWRKVSAEPLTFSCFRSPKTRSYACTLMLPLPQKEPRIFRSPPVYASKRAAIRALAEYAMQCGILGEAARSMALLDQTIDPYSLPGPSCGPFDGSSNPRFVSQSDYSTHQSPVTLLNLAVQKHCVEAPNVVLNFVHRTDGPHQGSFRGSIYRCDLRVRISPEMQETYATNASYPSTRLAKDAVAQLALQEGVVILLKLHNSTTTKICKQMGLAIPATLEDHDTPEEENTAGVISQLVQQVTHDPNAMVSTFSESRSETGGLFGAKIVVKLDDRDTRSYEMPPLFRNKKEAKEGVCRLAAKMGLRRDLEARMNITSASYNAIRNLGDNIAQAGDVHRSEKASTASDSSVSRLNTWAQSTFGSTDCLSYTFAEHLGPRGLGAVTNPQFGCVLAIQTELTGSRKYDSGTAFPSKKLAKEIAARLALESIFASTQARQPSNAVSAPLLRTSSDFDAQDSVISQDCRETSSGVLQDSPIHGSYQAHKNTRVQHLPMLQVPDTRMDTGPPPPYAESKTASSSLVTPAGLQNNATRLNQPYRATKLAYRSWTEDRPQSLPSLPFLQVLRQHFLGAFGTNGLSRITFYLQKVPGTGLYSGTLRLQLAGDDVRLFELNSPSTSVEAAKEALSGKAVAGNLLEQLSTAGQHQVADAHRAPADGQVSSARDYHPVSYVHQMCQILLGTEPIHKPDLEVFLSKDTSRLTIPVTPPKIYTCPAEHKSKAAAREAVAALSIEEGLVEYLKEYRKASSFGTVNHGTPPQTSSSKAKETRATELDPVRAVEQTKVPAAQSKPSYVEQLVGGSARHKHFKVTVDDLLLAFCDRTKLPTPVFQHMGPASPGASVYRVAVTIGQQIYEVEAKTDDIRKPERFEKLAKRVLKHFLTQTPGGASSAARP